MDDVVGDPVVEKRGAAGAAETALHFERALEHRWLAPGPFDRALLHRERCEERPADRLLTHPAVANTDLKGRLVDGIAHRAALAAAAQSDFAHDPLPSAGHGSVSWSGCW